VQLHTHNHAQKNDPSHLYLTIIHIPFDNRCRMRNVILIRISIHLSISHKHFLLFSKKEVLWNDVFNKRCVCAMCTAIYDCVRLTTGTLFSYHTTTVMLLRIQFIRLIVCAHVRPAFSGWGYRCARYSDVLLHPLWNTSFVWTVCAAEAKRVFVKRIDALKYGCVLPRTSVCSSFLCIGRSVRIVYTKKTTKAPYPNFVLILLNVPTHISVSQKRDLQSNNRHPLDHCVQ
jgi:hypothetical protein